MCFSHQQTRPTKVQAVNILGSEAVLVHFVSTWLVYDTQIFGQTPVYMWPRKYFFDVINTQIRRP